MPASERFKPIYGERFRPICGAIDSNVWVCDIGANLQARLVVSRIEDRWHASAVGLMRSRRLNAETYEQACEAALRELMAVIVEVESTIAGMIGGSGSVTARLDRIEQMLRGDEIHGPT